MFGHGSRHDYISGKRSKNRISKSVQTVMTNSVVVWLILVCSGIPIPELHCHELKANLSAENSVLANHLAAEQHPEVDAGWLHCHVDPADILNFGLQRHSDHETDGSSNSKIVTVVVAPTAGEHVLSLAIECSCCPNSICIARDTQKVLSSDRSPRSRLRSVLATYLPSLSARQLLQVAIC